MYRNYGFKAGCLPAGRTPSKCGKKSDPQAAEMIKRRDWSENRITGFIFQNTRLRSDKDRKELLYPHPSSEWLDSSQLSCSRYSGQAASTSFQNR